MRLKILSYAAAGMIACAASPAYAAVYDFDLTGQIANGTTSIFTSGGTSYNIFSVSLAGFDTPFDLMVGDVLNLNVMLDGLVTVPASQITFFGVDALTTPQEFALLTSGVISSSSLTPSDGDLAGQTFFGGCSNCIAATASLANAPAFQISALTASITIENLSLLDPNNTSPVTLNGFAFRYQATDFGGAVPEPAQWALMLSGFGFAGAAMRHRRKQVRVTYA